MVTVFLQARTRNEDFRTGSRASRWTVAVAGGHQLLPLRRNSLGPGRLGILGRAGHRRGLRRRDRPLGAHVGKQALEPTGTPPVGPPEQFHGGGDENDPNDRGVDGDGNGKAKTDLLERSGIGSEEGAEHDHHHGGRRRDPRPVDAQSGGNRTGIVASGVVMLPNSRKEEHLVVHAQPKNDGEEHHRGPRLDRGSADSDQVTAPTPLEDGDHYSVGRADRQQVHEHGLQGHEHRTEYEQ